MTQSRSLLGTMLADASPAHPHLSSPINSHAIARERAKAIHGMEGLMAYQRFLADARAIKAERRRVSKAFERHVQTQSRQALADLEAFTSSALRTAGQVNQTEYWRTSLQRSATALNDTGPITAQDLWRDIRGRADVMSLLADFGFSDSMAAMSDQAIAATDVVARTAEGRVEIAARLQGSGEELHVISLIGTRGRPKTVTELLGRASFDQLATTFSRPGDGYIPAISATSSRFEPDELVALAAFASRQLLVDHVRKLEDTGLSTHAGGGPGPVIALLLVGLTLYLAGLWIADMCNDPQVINPPSDATCQAGGILTFLGIILIAGAAGAAVGAAALAAGVSAYTLSGALILLAASVGGYIGVFTILLLEASIAGAFDALGAFEAPNLADEPT